MPKKSCINGLLYLYMHICLEDYTFSFQSYTFPNCFKQPKLIA